MRAKHTTLLVDATAGGNQQLFSHALPACPCSSRFGRAAVLGLALALFALMASGCLQRRLKPLNPCLVSGVVERIQVVNVDKVDILFMVDNSGSMKEEQANLAKEFPKLVQVLTSGYLSGMPTGAPQDFPPVPNLHLGVVSSDMGLVGVPNIPSCGSSVMRPFGDDGVLIQDTRDPAMKPGCQMAYPPGWIQYQKPINDPFQAATDFGCLATLGTGGCGFEQQLEAVLKALTPPSAGPMFVADHTGAGALGHGGLPGDPTPGRNAGFLRPDSLLTVVMVTDEEDCSSHNLDHFKLSSDLPPGHPVLTNIMAMDPNLVDELNLRCFFNKQNLHPIDRYVQGLKNLRPGQEKLVIFAAIVGVPKNAVDAGTRLMFNNLLTPQDRANYYQNLYNHPLMQEMIDPTSLATPPAELRPSCNDPLLGKAQPPIRIVQVAEQFGRNGVVQSICQDDFGPALDAIIQVISDVLNDVCLPRRLNRDVDGLVACDVVWELPAPQTPGLAPDAITRCDQAPYLSPPPPGRSPVTERGGNRCVVQQVPVRMGVVDPTVQGWHYDDFSLEVQMNCPTNPQRIVFPMGVKPPNGTTVRLECLSEIQGLSGAITSRFTQGQVEIGGPCLQGADPPCIPGAASGPQLCCHNASSTWAIGCQSQADCPPGWVCDQSPITLMAAGAPVCTNPTCSGR
ncbi:MAG: VWA domain-containing protein [Proteobacteria bacterium]|nr:VWA domain-containing protein [Pseudomonadota bacterium]